MVRCCVMCSGVVVLLFFCSVRCVWLFALMLYVCCSCVLCVRSCARVLLSVSAQRICHFLCDVVWLVVAFCYCFVSVCVLRFKCVCAC